MNFRTEELLVITLAVVIFVGIFLTISPSLIGYVVLQPDFNYNDNVINENGIQLKQHLYNTTWITQENLYYILTSAEENGNDKLNKLSVIDDNVLELEKRHLLKIRFDNVLENNDVINLYLKGNKDTVLNICSFNAQSSCENETIYGALSYSGIEGNYQVMLSLPESTNKFSIDPIDALARIDYINASHTEITEHTNTTYYYNSDSIETETIQPENLSSWGIFTADYALNNQAITFYYKTSGDYMEFQPPYNFSDVNSSGLTFKIFLASDNTTTPIIYNISISYTEITPQVCIENWTCSDWSGCTNGLQIRACTDLGGCGTYEAKPLEVQNCSIPSAPQPSEQAPSSRYETSTTIPKAENVKTEVVSQKVEVKTNPEKIENKEVENVNIEELEMVEKTGYNVKTVMNSVALGYLCLLCFLIYRKSF